MSDVKYRPPAYKPFEVQALPKVRFEGTPAGSPEAELLYRQHAPVIHWFHSRASQAHHAGITDYTKLRGTINGLSLQYANINGQEIIDVRLATSRSEAKEKKLGPSPTTCSILIEFQPVDWSSMGGIGTRWETGDTGPISVPAYDPLRALVYEEQEPIGDLASEWRAGGETYRIGPGMLIARPVGVSAEVLRDLPGLATSTVTDQGLVVLSNIDEDTNPADWFQYGNYTFTTYDPVLNWTVEAYRSVRLNINLQGCGLPPVLRLELYGGHTAVLTEVTEQAIYVDGGAGDYYTIDAETRTLPATQCRVWAELENGLMREQIDRNYSGEPGEELPNPLADADLARLRNSRPVLNITDEMYVPSLVSGATFNITPLGLYGYEYTLREAQYLGAVVINLSGRVVAWEPPGNLGGLRGMGAVDTTSTTYYPITP